MARAIWNGAVLAESDDVIVVDGYTYFPRDAVDFDLLAESSHTSVCVWKGRASYYTVVVDGAENRDAAWYYPTPSVAARKVDGRIAFWRGVKIVTDETAVSERRPGLMDRLRLRVGAGGADANQPRSPIEHHHDHEAHEDAPVVDLDDGSFEAGTEGAWTVVDFWAAWCGPCKAFHPIFDQAASETPGVRFARCNVDASPHSASALGILSIPTVVLFDPDGNEADRVVGVPPRKDLNRLLARATTRSGSAA